jgi:hypothetical protein
VPTPAHVFAPVHAWFHAAAGLIYTCYAYACFTPGLRLAYAWLTPGLRLAYAWLTPGLRLAYAWVTPGLHPVRERRRLRHSAFCTRW